MASVDLVRRLSLSCLPIFMSPDYGLLCCFAISVISTVSCREWPPFYEAANDLFYYGCGWQVRLRASPSQYRHRSLGLSSPRNPPP